MVCVALANNRVEFSSSLLKLETKLEQNYMRVIGQSFFGTSYNVVRLHPCKISRQYKNYIKKSLFTSYKKARQLKILFG